MSAQNVERKRDVSIPMGDASAQAFIIALPMAVIQLIVFALLHGLLFSRKDAYVNLFTVMLFFGIFLHEAIHLIAWLLSTGKPMSAFKMGFYWKALTPYAHCREIMDIHSYRIGSVAPGIVLGILPWLISLITGSHLLCLYGVLYTAAASGDFLALWLLRFVKAGTLVEDHPSKLGCYVIERETTIDEK